MSDQFPLVPKPLEEALAELSKNMADLAAGVDSDGAHVLEVRPMGGVGADVAGFVVLVDFGTDVPVNIPIAVKPAVSIEHLVHRLCHTDCAPRTLH